MSGCKTKHDEGVESGNETGIALIILNDSQVHWVWHGFVMRRTYQTAEDMSYFRCHFPLWLFHIDLMLVWILKTSEVLFSIVHIFLL